MSQRKPVSRRRFLKAAGAVPVVAGLSARSFAAVQGSNEALRLAWIGVGGRGSSLLGHSLNCVSESNLTVSAICDIDQGAMNRAVEKCGGMKPKGFLDYRKMLESKDIDLVFIATPIYLHAEHAVAVMEAGKHSYCEKPLGRTPQEVKAVFDAVKKAGKKFQLGFQWRYHEGFLALVHQIQSGAVGKVNFVNGERHVGGYPTEGWYVDRNLSGDLIVEQAVHEMNIFCWMLRSHPLRASGLGGINALKDVPPGRSIMDHYAVTYEFPEAITVAYSHCVYTPGGFGGLFQEVYGSGGKGAILEDTYKLAVTKDGKKTDVSIPRLSKVEEIENYEWPEETKAEPGTEEKPAEPKQEPAFRDATEFAIQSLARCIREDREPLSNVDAGKNATLMAILGRTAIHERRVVEWKEVAI